MLSDQALLLGSKGKILTFDLSKQSLLSTMKITDDPLESIFDIKVLPPHYALPPVSFPEHLAMTTGYASAEEIIECGFRFQNPSGMRVS